MEQATQETNEYLGMTAVPDGKSNISYVICAQYAKKSTVKNPMIEIQPNKEDSIGMQVDIKSVNPKHATMLEMLALCSYADATGIYKGEDTCSYGHIKGYLHNAAMNGMCKDITNYKDFCNRKINWDGMINQMTDIYLKQEEFEQYQQCLKLMEMFDYFEMIKTMK